MVERADNWKTTFRAEIERRLKGEGSRAKFVREITDEAGPYRCGTRQAVYKWLRSGQISDENLKEVARYFEVDYGQLRLYGKFVPEADAPAQRAENRRRTDVIREAAAGYDVPLPGGAQIAARWDALPKPVQGFLLSQIESFEALAEANGELTKMMFTPAPGEKYKAWEASVARAASKRR